MTDIQNETEFKSTMADLPWTTDQQDLLGVKRYQDALVDYINHVRTPFTIAIQGEWGSGKTSLMNAIYDRLCKYNNPEFYGIRINTWQFSLLSTPQCAVISIIKSIVDQISIFHPDHELTDKVTAMLARFLFVAAKITYDVADQLVLGGLLRKSGWSSKELENALSYIKNGSPQKDDKGDTSSDDDDAVTIENLKCKMRKLINNALILSTKCRGCNDCSCEYKELSNKLLYNGPKKGFIFFIDDLDRVDPVLAVDVLDIIKNVFDLPNCVFVIAVDYNVIVKGLEPKLGKLNDQNEWKFREYFEKLVQLPITIPSQFEPVNNFIREGLRDIGFLRYSNFIDDQGFINELQAIACKSIIDNPRRLKRLINALSLIDKIMSFRVGEITGHDEDYKAFKMNKNYNLLIFIYTCLQLEYPKVYELLLFHPNPKTWNTELAKYYHAPEVAVSDLLTIKSQTNSSFEYEEWELVLFRICQLKGLSGFVNIRDILARVIEIYEQDHALAGIWQKLRAEVLITKL